MLFGDRPHHRQAQSRAAAFSVPAFLKADEALEHALSVLWRNARAIVAHDDVDEGRHFVLSVGCHRSARERDLRARIARCVVQHVAHGVRNRFAICPAHKRLDPRNVHVAVGPAGERSGFLEQQVAQIQRLLVESLDALVMARELQQVAHDAAHAVILRHKVGRERIKVDGVRMVP